MLYVIHCLDHPERAALRQANTDAHAQYMRAHADRVRLGGPLVSTDGQTRIGVLVVIDFDDRDALQAFIEHEPYRRAGLFARVDVHPFARVMPAPNH